MEFLGIGGWELVVVFILMLVVAGPKRMLSWSYTLGRYLAVLRNLWAETATALQREFNEAGVDVQIPKEVPTRASVSRLVMDTVNKAAAPVTDPLKSLQNEAQVTTKDLLGPTPRVNKPVTQYPGAPAPKPKPVTPATSTPPPPAAPVPETPPAETFGAWGAAPAEPPAPVNGDTPPA